MEMLEVFFFGGDGTLRWAGDRKGCRTAEIGPERVCNLGFQGEG